MKNLSLVLILIIGVVAINAQTRGNPTPTPDAESPIDEKRQDNINSRSNDLRSTEKFPVEPVNRDNKTFREKIRPIYRKPDKEEREILAPNSEDETKFAQFLKSKKTGLTKLIIDKGCDKDVGVIVSTPHCLKYSMPGAGASYSFRYDNYRIRYLSDINFTGKFFQSVGVLTHGIFADIGDVPLEDVNLNTKGIEFLEKIEPAESFAEAKTLIDKLEKGIENDGFIYKNNLPIKENTTYILRSIAYRGNSFRTVAGIMFDELEFDKREDITVAFRVVRVEPDESVTILWKKLDSKKAPKIEADK
jgi:hypothetical protein